MLDLLLGDSRIPEGTQAKLRSARMFEVTLVSVGLFVCFLAHNTDAQPAG